jgi:hypothetical protein
MLLGPASSFCSEVADCFLSVKIQIGETGVTCCTFRSRLFYCATTVHIGMALVHNVTYIIAL